MCPFVDATDNRCAAHLTFRNLFSAYAHCADCYTSCRVYQQLMAERPVLAEACYERQHVLVAG